MHMPSQVTRHPVYLGKARKLLVYGTGLGLWLSGVAWLGLHYFARRETEFGPAPHPFEHWSLVAHGAFAFAGLWVFGLLWSAHIPGAWKTRRHRVTGSVLFLLLCILIVGGFLLYYVGDDNLRPWISLSHWGLGLGLPVTLLWHRLARRL